MEPNGVSDKKFELEQRYVQLLEQRIASLEATLKLEKSEKRDSNATNGKLPEGKGDGQKDKKEGKDSSKVPCSTIM